MLEKLPSTGLKGLLDHWKDDLSAAVSVSLVALPLALGIALASGAPPMSGLLAAVIGGIVTTIFRGSHVAINGPAAGLIVVVLTGVESLADENGSGFPYVLAAIAISGVIQMLLGLLKMGKLGDLFPDSVISGMLATIGIIILVKQFHVALGVNSNTGSVLQSLTEIPNSLLNLNPVITIISIISLYVLIIHPKLKNSILKSIPAPLQVLIVSVPIVLLINTFSDTSVEAFGNKIFIERDYLISIPDNILDSIIFPDFSKIMLPEFWMLVISITLIASIETLILAKAVDKLDHFKRRTNLNKDLFAIGLSTAVSGFLGGLPIITVIVRSSVNVNHNAKTKWSNFYHGIILLAFVFLFPFIIREIPMASLATILVYTGYKLVSPRVFGAVLLKGWEQLFIMVSTLLASLAFDLLWGILIGIITTLLVHWVRSQLNLGTFWKHLVNTEIKVMEEAKGVVHIEIIGIANFAIMLKLINSLQGFGNGKHFIVDFSHTKLVDSTVLDFIHGHREKYFTETDFEFTGLDVHKTSSPHPLALHVLKKPMQKRLTGRQKDLYDFSLEHQYRYKREINWMVDHFEKFFFLEYHLMEYQRNRLEGSFDKGVEWIISDLTYNDGVMIAREEHHITVMVLSLYEEKSSFMVTKDDSRYLKVMLKALKGVEIPDHLSVFAKFLDDSASFHIERIGKELLIYKKERLLSAKEIITMHNFAQGLIDVLPESENAFKELKDCFED